MSRKLIVSDGRRQRELLIVSKIVVGRDPTCDLSEADPLLSRRHAEFAISGDDIVVRDLGSRNGIYINGARTAEGTLQSGDVVRIGRLHMRYIEDSAPLVAMPELVDDATGLVIPGPRPGPSKPPPAATPGPPSASASQPRPAGASGAMPKPAPPIASRPTPMPAPDETDADATSYVSPSAVRKAPAGVSGSSIKAQPQVAAAAPGGPAAQPSPPAGDEVEQTRVVPAPGRSGARPPIAPAAKSGVQPSAAAPPPGTSVQPPPVPLKDDERTSYVTPRPRTSVQAPPAAQSTLVVPPPAPPVEHTAVQAPPAPPVIHTAGQPPPVMLTAVQPPPSPPAEDMDEPTSVILMPRSKARTGSAPDPASSERVLQARALALAVQAIVTFLGSSPKGQRAADAVRLLERDLAAAAPPGELVDALKGLAARVSAAANELT